MEELPALLCSASLFAGLNGEELSSALHCLGAREAAYGKGVYILRAGDRTGSMGLLLSGSLLVLQEDFWGNRNLLSSIGPGQLFAESFACSPGTALSVSVAAASAAKVLWLDVGRVLDICPRSCPHHSRILRNLLSALAEKNLRFNEKLTHIGQRSTREKLLSYLSMEARRQGSTQFDIPFKRQELADYLSVERSAMCAALGKLRDEGVLSFHKNHFVLHIPGDMDAPGPRSP